jgi:hypothetical protein
MPIATCDAMIFRLTMNVYTHTNHSDMVEAVGKLPGLRSDSVLPAVEKPRVKTSRKEARKAKWKEKLQRYSSISVAEDGNSRQLPSEGVDARTAGNDEGRERKSLPDRDLAEDDGACHSKSSTPGEVRTPNPRFRRPMLYPVELRMHKLAFLGVF